MPDLHISLISKMTSFVTENRYDPTKVVWPSHVFINRLDLKFKILEFLGNNPEGVRNRDVGIAIGYQDTRQWFSYGILEQMIKDGDVEKKSINKKTLYFRVN